ncbi:MAG: hypothetical protein LBL82_00200 [Oscillospiraceae bacterium]|jgi:hypothetical protein|nr:hypothetical protein [Oscillospiraceae bacterium]
MAANKSEVTFVDTSPEVKKALIGLSKTALRASGKVVRKLLRDNIYTRSKRIKNHIASWAFVDRSTGQPQLQVGFYGRQRVKKRGKLPSHASPHWIEFGTRPHKIRIKNARVLTFNDVFFGSEVSHPGQKATNVLRDTVHNNVSAIKEAQAEFLAELNKELAAAGAKIVESEEVEDD